MATTTSETTRERTGYEPPTETATRARYTDEPGVFHKARSLARETVTLVRQEAELARAEMSEKLDQARAGVTELSIGALVTWAGLLFLLFALYLGVDALVEEPWVSALIVGGVVTLLGLALLAAARKNLRARNLTPDRTTSSLRQDAELLRHETKRTNP